MSRVSCSSTFELYVRYVLDGLFGKTYRERSQARMGRLSDSSCPKWTSSGTVWRGAYSMRSSSEWPKDAAVSFLSDILEPAPPVGVLIERESMRGDYPSSREKREALAEESGRSPRSAGFKFHQGAGAGGVGAEPEQSPTLTADWHNPAVYSVSGNAIGRKPGNGPNGKPYGDDDLSFTLTATDRHAVAFAQNQRDEVRLVGDGRTAGALAARPGAKQQTYVCMTGDTGNPSEYPIGEPITMADLNANTAIGYGMVVRRLTPTECERLQGFPDGWTKAPYRGKPAEACPDAPRYRALGNSMAVPVMRWIGGRIAAVDGEETA